MGIASTSDKDALCRFLTLARISFGWRPCGRRHHHHLPRSHLCGRLGDLLQRTFWCPLRPPSCKAFVRNATSRAGLGKTANLTDLGNDHEIFAEISEISGLTNPGATTDRISHGRPCKRAPHGHKRCAEGVPSLPQRCRRVGGDDASPGPPPNEILAKVRNERGHPCPS